MSARSPLLHCAGNGFVRLVAGLAILLGGLFSPQGANASASGVVISQVYGGNGNAFASDYVELFNAGGASVDIAGWSIQYASATGTGTFASNGVTVLSGNTVLAPGQYYLVALATSSGPALPAADATGSTNLSGTSGKVVLVNGSAGLACNGGSSPCSAQQLAQIVDLVGYGSANFFEGAAAPAATSSTALLRIAAGCVDSDQNNANFSLGTPAPRNRASALSPCTGSGGAAIAPSCPASLSVATGAQIGFALSARDPDSIVNAVTLPGPVPGGVSIGDFVAAPADGGAATARLVLDGSTPAGGHAVTVRFSNDDGQSADCVVNLALAAPSPSYTPIFAIQGAGSVSTMTGVRTTRGVVTRVNGNGYFIQDPVGDGDPLTSDGIFVFTGGAPVVAAGHMVQITGTVVEFNTGAAANPLTLANPVTEFSNVTATQFIGTGTVTPTPVTLPLATAADWERYEGMLVQITSPLTVSQNYFLGRYGQVTVAAGGRLRKPTDIHPPGSAAALGLADLNARSALILDDGTSQQNPSPIPYIGADNTLRAGDTVAAGLVGVVDYGLATSDSAGLAMVRLHPVGAPVISRTNARSATPPAVGGNLRVASFNVLNFFTTFGDGGTAAGGSGQGCLPSGTTGDCRGADNATEFSRQRDKIVRAIAGLDADVVGLMEMQRNGDVATQALVDALNAHLGGPVYAVVPEPATGAGTDAIKVAMIYKPAAVARVGGALSDGAAIHNRPPLAQTFVTPAGARFSVVVNHFKSKGCDGASGADLDQGDGQGCFNARRVAQAQALLSFVSTVKAAAGDDDVLVIGDLNAYSREDPVETLKAGGLVDQDLRLGGPGQYSYVFDGEAGSLDHALATASLSAQVVGAAHWRINADEPSVIDYNTDFKTQDLYSASPWRASDHDPVLIGIQAVLAPQAQTITFVQPAARRLDQTPLGLTASASSGLPVSLTSLTPLVCAVAGTNVSLLAVGECSIAADQAGDPVYAPAALVVRTFTVFAGLAQSISFPVVPDQLLGAGPLALVASASSGLAVGFTSTTPAVCSVGPTTVSLIAAGACTIVASQPGDANWLPAQDVTRTFIVAAQGTGGGPADGDAPLPAWAIALLAAGLARFLARRR